MKNILIFFCHHEHAVILKWTHENVDCSDQYVCAKTCASHLCHAHLRDFVFHALACMNGHSLDRSPLCFHLSACLQCTCGVDLCLFTSVFHFLVWLQFNNLPEWCILVSAHLCINCDFQIQVICVCRPSCLWAQTCYGSPVTYLHVVTWEVLSTTCETRNHEHFYMRPIWVLLFVRFCSKNYVHCHRRCNFNPIVGLVLKPFWKFECKFRTRSIRNNRRYSWHMYKCTNPLYESSQVSSNKLATYDGDESSHPLCRSSQV